MYEYTLNFQIQCVICVLKYECSKTLIIFFQKVKDLKKEIQILKKLKHNNIVVFYLYEETAETLSMFMEYVPGVSWISDFSQGLVFLIVINYRNLCPIRKTFGTVNFPWTSGSKKCDFQPHIRHLVPICGRYAKMVLTSGSRFYNLIGPFKNTIGSARICYWSKLDVKNFLRKLFANKKQCLWVQVKNHKINLQEKNCLVHHYLEMLGVVWPTDARAIFAHTLP